MKRKISKILSVVLTVSCLLSCCTVFAGAIDVDNKQVYEKIEHSLQSVVKEKELYGLDENDIDNLFVGMDIPVYEVADGRIEQMDIKFYPILNGDNNPLIIAATYCVDEGMAVSLSNEFIDCLSSSDSGDELAFIYDNNGVYLLKNDVIMKLADDASDVGQYRDSITSFDELELSKIDTANMKSVYKTSVNIQAFGEDDESVYLNVPKVYQPKDSSICWAACVASIVNFKFNKSLTAENVAYEFRSTSAMNTETIIEKMNKHYGTGYLYGTESNNQDNIWKSLNKNNPVEAGFSYNTGGTGHGMVIRGIHYGYSFSVMDPLDTKNTYRVGQISGTSKSAEFTILSWTGGSVMTLGSYGYKAS